MLVKAAGDSRVQRHVRVRHGCCTAFCTAWGEEGHTGTYLHTNSALNTSWLSRASREFAIRPRLRAPDPAEFSGTGPTPMTGDEATPFSQVLLQKPSQPASLQSECDL